MPYLRPDWHRVHQRVRACADAVDQAWRALNYLCAAQLYLQHAPPHHTLTPADVKESPQGHWGVSPPVNLALAHLSTLIAAPSEGEAVLVHGAGHAGPSALAHAYLTGALRGAGSGPVWSTDALNSLVGSFPEGRHGGEITALIPGIRYMGGQLGPALAVAQGMAMDAPHRLAIPLIGDGEAETGLTAAAWTAHRALPEGGEHGHVLPVVLLNGLRMGGPSLLASMPPHQVRSYFTGLGYTPLITDGSDLRTELDRALQLLRPLGSTGAPVLVLTAPKGHTGPASVKGRPLLGTPAMHKTPLSDPRSDPDEFRVLARWLASYHPAELFTHDGAPTRKVRTALPTKPSAPHPRSRTPMPDATRSPNTISEALTNRAAHGAFRLFSPDELRSNRLLPTGQGEPPPPWVAEILNEEICHAWLQGYTETGRHALLASYEAFAPINTSLLTQHLKHLRLTGEQPSVNYLITSLGWRNTYTHRNPGLVTSLLEIRDPRVRVYTPADPIRAARTLAHMLTDRGHVNVLIYDKYSSTTFPLEHALTEEATGAAVWTQGPQHAVTQLVLASVGDLCARQISAGQQALLEHDPKLVLRRVHVHDLSALGRAPHALSDNDFTHLFPAHAPVLIATPTYPGTVRNCLHERGPTDRFHIVGYREPTRPGTHGEQLAHSALTVEALRERARSMIEEYQGC
ncbi:putative phosphoketolase [Nocardiopsis kunsanensis]|uniref:Phosphoketolase n=1 Tax=Nocardiopsis kunsanensis TaxID=141693 RepID=A0A919CKS8_9ACTN|nr:phosphoketolase [Nocardiopsis kunsanensis]GHD34509.1 putative phosphoketolase [Nocardiopsis kunsanensis]